MNEINSPMLLDVLRRMALTRLSELLIARKYPEQKMKCPTHLCLGQEATGAVLGTLARPGDLFFGNYRSHGHYLGRDADLTAMFAEILGFKEGCSGGLGGSMHLVDASRGFVGASAIVASTVPIAAGAALALKRKSPGQVAVVFFGDGAMEEGVVYETANLAVLHGLPLVFVCENNRLAILTPIEQRASRTVLHDRFASLGLPGVQVDGNDPAGLLAAAEQAYAGARSHRPAFLEVPVSRWAVHVGPAFEGPVDAWWQEPDRAAERCPLAAAACALLAADRITLDGLRDLRDRLNSEVEAAFVRAERGTPPPPSTLGDVCAGGLHSPLPTAGSGSVAPTDQPHREQPPLVNPF